MTATVSVCATYLVEASEGVVSYGRTSVSITGTVSVRATHTVEVSEGVASYERGYYGVNRGYVVCMCRAYIGVLCDLMSDMYVRGKCADIM